MRHEGCLVFILICVTNCASKDGAPVATTSSGTTEAAASDGSPVVSGDTTTSSGSAGAETASTGTSDSGATGTGDEAGDGSAADTGPPLTPDVCAMIEDAAVCFATSQPYVDGFEQFTCIWVPVIEATRTGSECVVTESSRCVADLPGGGGCISAPGCNGSSFTSAPLVRVESRTSVVLSAICMDPAPPGWEYCNSGLAADADPPECACACELWPGDATGTTG